MTERQPILKRPFALTSSLNLILGCLSLLLIISTPMSFATASDITITSPPLNGKYTTTSIPVSGTFVSPSNPPAVIVTIDGSSVGAVVTVSSIIGGATSGTWYATIGAGNGWHTVKATISDSNGAYTDKVQFYVNDGTSIVKQIKFNQINVEYSQACLALLKSGDTKSCPTLDKLIPADTSNQHVSGKFVITPNGYIRTASQMKNAYEFYTKPTVCVICPIDANSESTMKNIWIVPRGYSYVTHDFTAYSINDTSNSGTYHVSTVNEQNAGLTIYHDKYVDDSCMSAQVTYKDQNTIPDTVKYLNGGCVDKSYFNTTQTVVPNTPFSYDNPGSSLHYDSYLQSIFQGHKVLHNENMPTGGGLGPTDCIRHQCSFTDPYKKVGY